MVFTTCLACDQPVRVGTVETALDALEWLAAGGSIAQSDGCCCFTCPLDFWGQTLIGRSVAYRYVYLAKQQIERGKGPVQQLCNQCCCCSSSQSIGRYERTTRILISHYHLVRLRAGCMP
jgi:hypothetical protein